MSTAGTIYDQEIRLGTAKLISSQVVASPVSSVIFSSAVLDPLFDTFLFRFIDVVLSAVGNYLYMAGAVNGVGTPDGTQFEIALIFTTSHLSPGGNFSYSTSTGAFSVTTVLASGPTGGGEVYWNRSDFDKQFTYQTTCYSSASYGQVAYFGSAKAKANIQSVFFYPSAGTITSGTFRCYGFRKGA